MTFSWPLTADGLYAQAEAKMLLPLDPTGTAIIQVKPDADAVAHGFAAVEVGPPGPSPTFADPAVVFTPLDPDDESEDYCTLTTTTEPTDTTAGVYQFQVGLHTGQDGAPGDTVLTPTDYADTPIAGQMLVVKSGATEFELESQKVGGRHLPVHMYSTSVGNSKSTVGVISVASGTYDFDYTFDLEAQCVVTGTGPDVLVNLVARLDDESGGNIIGFGFGVGCTEGASGNKDRLILADGPPSGSPGSWGVIPAGAGATVYLRTEKQDGSDFYTTSIDTTWFRARVVAVP